MRHSFGSALLLMLLSPAALSQCKQPLLTMSYNGVGTVTEGKYLYLMVCDTGEVQYDEERGAEHPTTPVRSKGQLSANDLKDLRRFLDTTEVRGLTGNYVGVGDPIDHHEWAEITIFRPAGPQHFSAVEFYEDTRRTYPAEFVALLCRADAMRTKSDWHAFETLCQK